MTYAGITLFYTTIHVLMLSNFFELNRRDCHQGHALSIVVPCTTTSAFKFTFAQRKIAQ